MALIPPEQVTGVILAGGQGRRLGGADKGLVEYQGKPLVTWVLAALRPQVGPLLISANRNQDRYRVHGVPVIADDLAGFQGPLAGIAAALAAATTPWILTVPCDTPHLPPDLAHRLATALQGGRELAVAHDGVGPQPLHALLPVTLAADLGAFLAAGERQARAWQARLRLAQVDFSDRPGAFANFNRLPDGGHRPPPDADA